MGVRIGSSDQRHLFPPIPGAISAVMEQSAFSGRYSPHPDSTSDSPRTPPGRMSEEEQDKLLSDRNGRKLLRKIAQEHRCVENLQFMDLYYEHQAAKNADDRLRLAKRLLEQHLLVDTPAEVNLEHSSRVAMEGLANRLDRGLMTDCPNAVFDEVYLEVRGMIASTVLPHYHDRRSGGKSEKKKTKLKAFFHK